MGGEEFLIALIPISLFLSLLKIIILKVKKVQVKQLDKYPMINIAFYSLIEFLMFMLRGDVNDFTGYFTSQLAKLLIIITLINFICLIIKGNVNETLGLEFIVLILPYPFIIITAFASFCYFLVMVIVNIYIIFKYLFIKG